MDAVLLLQPEVRLQIVHQYNPSQVPAQPAQILDVLATQPDRMVPVEPEADMLHVADDNIRVLGHAAGEDAQLVVQGHSLQELEHVRSDQEFALVAAAAALVDFVVD